MRENSITVCAIAKDEIDYLIEWIAYYRCLGVDNIIIYDNDSIDGSSEVLKNLSDLNIIQYVAWPTKAVSPQLTAYADALKRCETTWILCVDIDEFLYIHDTPDNIKPFLDRFGETISAIAVNWRVFGSSGLTKKSSAPVIERFTMAAKPASGFNFHCKTISRVADTIERHIHRAFVSNGQYVNTSLKEIEIERWGFTPSIDHNLAQINHYVLKSREEFEAKARRGNANRGIKDPEKYERINDRYFELHDLNETSETGILTLLDRVKSEMGVLVNTVKSARSDSGENNMVQPSENAILWWRQLFSELGTAACTGDKGVLGQLARDRAGAVLNLFFTIADEARATFLYEVGAHNAESSRRFIAGAPYRKAAAYEASRRVYNRVSAGNLPDGLSYMFQAIGSEKGQATFYEPVDDKYAVWSSTLKRAGNVETTEYKVDVTTLDAVSKGHDLKERRSVVWIDVEGAGYDVIKGATRLLEANVAALYIEVNDLQTYENSATALEVLQSMLDLGFIPVARDNQYHDAYNILFVHRSVYLKTRVSIAKWHYKHSGNVRSMLAAMTPAPAPVEA